jgi:hypothetical protein
VSSGRIQPVLIKIVGPIEFPLRRLKDLKNNNNNKIKNKIKSDNW